MSPVVNTFLGRKSEPRPDSEFTIFNLAIRLSKVEQLAFFPLVTHWASECCNCLPPYGASPFFWLLCKGHSLSAMETPFFNFAQETDRCHSNMSMISGRYMPSGMVILSFDGRWRGSIVHLIQLGTTDSCLHTGSDLTTEGLEPDHEFCMRVWMHLFHQQPNSPHWSPF